MCSAEANSARETNKTGFVQTHPRRVLVSRYPEISPICNLPISYPKRHLHPYATFSRPKRGYSAHRSHARTVQGLPESCPLPHMDCVLGVAICIPGLRTRRQSINLVRALRYADPSDHYLSAIVLQPQYQPAHSRIRSLEPEHQRAWNSCCGSSAMRRRVLRPHRTS
ncbi:hypothetical protein K432DRAFT_142882 [Lepidopterella palustris CBS 459.81]|uniref:Uncharacterized protein n=1 Tax=Lepidopterella palustris CBS 459.81 TaxID=1314670 RepID=A0A8E2JBN4_9PEZI|nr:hypothetical protein K432DRAFT_142882 [Lepidopterella palustris CBS 459.81]